MTLTTQSPGMAPPQGENDAAWLRTPGKQKQAFTINRIFSTDYLVCLKVSDIQSCLSGRKFQGLPGYLLEVTQGLVFSLECVRFKHSKPAELTLYCIAHIVSYLL